MRVLLIYPPITLHRLDVSPPSKSALVGLGYIGSVLQKAGHTVKILDCLKSSLANFAVDSDFRRHGIPDEQILEEIKSFNPEVVGISSMFTSYFKDAHNIARIVKEYNKDIFVIFGGAHASIFPDSVMKDSNVDVAVIGEGERTIVELLRSYQDREKLEGVKGISYRENGVVKKESAREFIENLDEIPFPAWDLLEEELETIWQEHKKNKFLMRRPIGYILTSRGCPNDCYFCSVKLVWSRKWRARSAKNIVDEIEFLKNKFGCCEFHFVDDNSSVSKKRMHEICDEILARNLNIKVATPTGIAIATLDKEILQKMKRAGFYRLCFGLETGDQECQKIIKKRINLNKAKEVIADANRIGFWTSGTFIIGFPHDTMKEIRATIDFIKSTNMDFAIVYLLTPQPGTEVYKIFKEQGLIDLDSYIDPHSEDWYKISITYCNGFKSLHFSNEELQHILSNLYKEFLKYKIFSFQTYVNILRKIKSIEDLKYMFKLISFPMNMIIKMITRKDISNVSIRNPEKELSSDIANKVTSES